jgi:hypothetical protein
MWYSDNNDSAVLVRVEHSLMFLHAEQMKEGICGQSNIRSLNSVKQTFMPIGLSFLNTF